MAETLTVQITAQDGATRVFKAVEGSASSMGKAVESAGKTGTAGIKSLSSELKRLDDEIDTIGKAMAGFGAGITAALALPLAKGTKAAWDQVSAVEQATFALGAYGDSTEDVNAALQDLTAYAQDASRSGGIFWSQDLFAAAQNLRVMGAELQNVSEYVQIMSRSVGIGAGSWDRLNEVIGRVGATGQLTAVDFQELSKMGFVLDESLRGAAVTWDELFAALDRGIPADALLGQADTIQGAILYLEGALVNLGQAFLGVDENFQFIAGGLGDQMVQGIRSVTESVNDLAPAAAAFGTGVGTVVTSVFKVVDAFNSLPEPMQQFIAMATGITGTTALAAGGILLMVSPLMRLSSALVAVGRSAAIMRTLTLAVNPLTLGVGALTVAGYSLWDSWREGERVAQSFEGAVDSLNSAYEQLLLSGQEKAAANVQLIRDLMADLPRLMEGQFNILSEGMTTDDFAAWRELKDAYTFTTEEAERFEAVQVSLGQRLSDSRINSEALTNEIERLYNVFLTDPNFTGDDFLAALEDLDARAVEEYRIAAEGAADATDNLANSATGLAEVWGLLKTEGEGVLDTLLNLNTVAEDDSFGDRLLKTLGLDASQRGQLDMTLETIRGLNAELEDMPEPGATQAEWIAWVNQEGISQAERTRRAEAANAARREEEASTRMATIAEIAHTSALDAGNAAMEEHAAQTEMALQIGESWNAHLEERNALIEENIARLQAAGGVDDPLSQWNLGAYATEMSLLADATLDAATGLESVFRVVVGNTDAIAGQADSVQSWIDTLMTWSDEQLNIHNLVAEGFVTQQQYNDALEAQGRITEANAHIQRDVMTMQTIQAPLIAEQTEALEEQLHIMSSLPAEQQLIALGWMDATTAGRAMEFQLLAVSAASGELGANGQQAFDAMITGAAQADPVLKALLVDMGLISEGANGEIIINMDGAEGAMSDMEKLRLTINALIETLGGEIPDLNLEVTGEDDVESLRESLLNLPSDLDFEVGVTVPDDDFIGTFIRDVTGTDAPAIELPVSADTGPALQDLEGLKTQPPIEIPVQLSTAIGNATDFVSDALGGLFGDAGAPQDVTVTIDAIDNASMVIGDVAAQLTILNAMSGTIDISVPNAYTTIGDLNGVQAAAEAVPASVTTWALVAGHIETIGALNGVQSAAEAIPNSVVTVISAVDNATPVIGDAVSFLASVDGYESTMTLNVVTNQITRISTENARHGGIPGYATGGVLFEGGEAGPEVAHFAGGGTALLPYHGYYSAPPNTYISPANANEGMGAPSGDTYITLKVEGNIYGTDEFVDALAASARDFFAGQGGGV